MIIPTDLRRALRGMVLSLCLAGAAPVAAQGGGDPFAARVPIEEDTQAARDRALREALSQVLETVVGRKDAAFAQLLPRAGRWAQQYGVVPPVGEEQGLVFAARFDPQAVKDELAARGLPVLGLDASMIEGWAVQVGGVRAAADYSRLLDYLAGLRGVRRVEVETLRDDALHLRLTVEGGIGKVREQVDQGLMMRPEGEGFYVFVGR